ncbi:MAG: hypothetical protein WAV38_08195 [Xanthobacteraceae bacterium]
MNWGKRSNPTWGWKLISDIYDTVHIALWSILIAAIIFFCLFTLPKIRQAQAQLDVQRILEIAAENRLYCEKWGFPVGADKHTACALDLQELRAKIEQRASDSMI